MPAFVVCRPVFRVAVFAAALLCSSAWAGTVLDSAALLGISPAQVRQTLTDVQPVRAPRRLSSGALGSLRVPDALHEGLHFEQTLFFAGQKLQQIDLVLPEAGPDATLAAQTTLMHSLRAELGPELAAFGSGGGDIPDTASWVNGDADIMLFRSGRPERPTLRIVIKQRRLQDASEL
ncbi:MAG: hypothetical protein V4614_10305 [Pseudomonadota bacterium]